MELDFIKPLLWSIDLKSLHQKPISNITWLDHHIILYFEDDNVLRFGPAIIQPPESCLKSCITQCIQVIQYSINDTQTFSTINIRFTQNTTFDLQIGTQDIYALKFVLNGTILEPLPYHNNGNIVSRKMASSLESRVLTRIDNTETKNILHFDDGTNLKIWYTDGIHITKSRFMGSITGTKRIILVLLIQTQPNDIHTETAYIEVYEDNTGPRGPNSIPMCHMGMRESNIIMVKTEYTMGG